jgi:hypothetical protein
MELLHNALSLLNQVPQEAWSMITEIFVSAVVISPVALGIKKWLEVNSEKLMIAGVMIASVAAPALLYLKSVPEFAAWIVLVQGGLVFATTQPVYYFFVKPLCRRLGTWFGGEVAKAAEVQAFEKDIKSALEPIGGLKPVAPQPPVAAVAAARVEIQHFQ